MKISFSKLFLFLLILGLNICCFRTQAQSKFEGLAFRIDSLANVGLPKSALKLVDSLDELARKNNNAPQQIRASIYRMTFQSYLEEDALVAIINRLKIDINKADFPVKPVLQSLLAQMYWNYYEQNRYKFNQRNKLQQADSLFTNWDIQTLINETGRLYDQSLQDAEKAQQTPVGVLSGVLWGDSTTRYLRPTLYDLLVQRAFDFFLADESGINKPKLPFLLNDPRFFSDSRTFADLQIKTNDTASTYFKGLKYLQKATTFHINHQDEEALADLDLKRLKFLKEHATVESKDSLYLAALKQIAEYFSAKPISAEALVLEGQYYQGIDSLTIAHSYFEKAVATYPKSLGGKNAAIQIKEIEQKKLSATVEDMNVPGKAILGLVSYRNVKEAEVSIYRLTEEQVKALTEKDAWYQGNIISPSNKVMKLIKQLAPVQQKQLTLTGINDYLKHTVEFEIEPLDVGNYIVLIKESKSAKNNLLGLTSFAVTHLSYSARTNPNSQKELLVMDRETGAPLHGVEVKIYYQDYVKGKLKTQIVSSGVSDANGKYIFNTKHEQYAVGLKKGDDVFTEREKYFNDFSPQAESNAPQIATSLYTDRQIYRPGQTIYFKGIRFSTLNGKSSIEPNTYLNIDFKDANNKTLGTQNLKTNEFGSVQGSFIIPQNTLSGQFSINAVGGQITVRVEEYKRPSFQVSFTPVSQIFHISDSVKIQGKVTAFSGYGISGAKIAVHVTARPNPIFDDSFINNAFKNKRVGSLWVRDFNQEIETDTLSADESGNFTIRFKPQNKIAGIGKGYVDYSVSAAVTDASGETQTASTNIKASDYPLTITTNIPKKILESTDAEIPLKLTDINDRPQNGSAQIKIVALKGGGQVYKNRLWTNPDKYILTKEAFKKAFPTYAWKNEDEFSSWPVANSVYDEKLNITDTTINNLNLGILKKQPSGTYKITISARNAGGDTISTTQYVNVIAVNPKAQAIDDWAIPIKTTVKKGQNAEFLIGINTPANILMETYSGTKLLSSKLLSIKGAYQQHVSVPIPFTEKNDFSVQYLMINNNRRYTIYQKVKVIDTAKSLNIKFLTFRDKLQPGEKEQWKLQIKSNDDKVLPAEMLADLYDASLDDIAPAQYWRTNFNYEPYSPDYFIWTNDDFVRQEETSLLRNNYLNYSTLERNYEQLNLFGYDYYGNGNESYTSYLERIEELKNSAKSDKRIADKYFKNATLVKNGYDIIGRVVSKYDGDSPLAGVKIGINNTGISTLSNSQGYFKIKVPKGSTLTFTLKGYHKRQIKSQKADNWIVKLLDQSYYNFDLGTKSLKGDKNYDVTIDEPVGSSDNKVAEVSAVRFPPPVLSPDREVKHKFKKSFSAGYSGNSAEMDSGAPGASDTVVMREILVKPGMKFNKDLLIEPKAPITLRSNFAETAFFYPQLQTNEKGEILINFTIPEALTRWKFRGFAHTKDLSTGYIENTVVTQKQLSISANTPRFLREGDTITISARLANLTAGTLKGKVDLKLFNALNMQPVSLLANRAEAEQDFEVAANTNKAVSFRLLISAGLDALTYRLTADAGIYTDGEENTLPVLPNRMLVTESLPMMVRAGQTRNFTFDKLVKQSSSTLKNKTLTLEYTQNPAWYAVQALPYMMEFPYECSEQVFSRYYANTLATGIVNKMPAIKRVFDQWKASNSTELLSNLEKNQELKATLLEETPWLNDAISESEQKKRIALLFDLNKMSDELKLNLDKLQKRQLPDGGFPWFGGERADRFITQHLAEGMGKLFHLGIANNQDTLKTMTDKVIKYLDGQLIADEQYRIKNKQEKYYGDLEIHAWYTRSFYLDNPLSADLQKMQSAYIKWAATNWTMRNVYEQGLIALTMQRYKKLEITAQIEKSLLETAQQTDELGMYWAKNQQGYFWYESPIETQSLLIDLFTEAGDNAKAVDEMKVWLLRNKQTNNWKTTTATAAACYALLLKGNDLLADTGKSTIKLDGKALEQLKPDVKADAGNGYLKTTWVDEQVKPQLGKVEINNSGKNISWGAMHWQYLENLDKITSAQTNIHLERKYYIQKQTDAGVVLTTVDASHTPKTGDLLKVVVHLKADRDFEYVQLKDMRPAGTEPVDAISSYKYQDGLYYYQVSKDVATNFFISELTKGSYVFEYQLRVAQPGNFSTGVTSIQCMYAPEFNAHSQGERMSIKP